MLFRGTVIGLFGAMMLLPVSLSASGKAPSFGFVENKGQWPSEVLYTANLASHIAVFIEKDGIRFNIADPLGLRHSHAHHHYSDSLTDDHRVVTGHAYKMYFTGCNTGLKVQPGDKEPDYLNFIKGKDPSAWVSHVSKYRWITLCDVYPGIDLRLSEKRGNLKLEWRVRRPATPDAIRVRYDGVEQCRISDGQLSILTSVGEVNEGYPESWVVKGGSRSAVTCDYRKEGKSVGFSLASLTAGYDTLVIDPELVFSTYSGSLADNWGFTATYDQQGNVFSGGIADGLGYPVTVGAWQQTFAGDWDVAIIKYDSTGTIRHWATYLGGSQADIPHSIVCDDAGNLFIFGTTGSADFPVTTGAYDVSFNGGTALVYDGVLSYPQGVDIFVDKLSSDGSQLLAGTYLGGSGNDGLNYRTRYAPVLMTGNDTLYYNYGDGARGEIAIDAQNYVYIGSCTFSTDYPVTQGVFQPQNRGKQEGVLTKLSSTLNCLVWSSYVGGTGDDAVYSIDVSSEGLLYAAGGTTSTNLLTTSGAPKPTFQGGSCDGFLLKSGVSGQQLLGLTYYGSNKYDQVYFVRADRYGNPHVFGQTKATGNTLVSNAQYFNTNGGQFIAKFNSSITSIVWSTVFGSGRTGPDISPTAFAVDVCNRIYVSGWGRYWGNEGGISWGSAFGTVGMSVTSNAFQSQTDGQDFYIGVFSRDMDALDYGTFFGEIHYAGCGYSGHDHVDGGTSRFDRKGNIYQSVCASCGGCQQFPTFPDPGAWSNTNNSGNCNNAVFKISLIADFALAAFDPVSPGCSPYAVQFHNTGRAVSWLWNFGDPLSGAANISTLKNPQHTFSQAGNYVVRLIAKWPESCNIADTMYRTVSVLSDTLYQLDSITACNGQPVQIGIPPSPDPSVTYQWIPETGLDDPHVSNPTAKAEVSTLYLLVTGNGVCTDSIYQMVMVDDVWIHAPGDTTVCDTVAVLQATSSPGSSLLWSSSPVFSDTLNDYPAGTSVTIHGQGTFVLYLKAESPFGCVATDSLTLILSKPDVGISGPDVICQGDSALFVVESPGESYSYHWKSSAAILSGQGSSSVTIRPFSSGYVAVKATDTLSGCSDTAILLFDVRSFVISIMTVPTTCFDTCDGEASLMITGGQSPYTVTWCNGQTGFSATNLCSGLQWARIVDSQGCDSLFQFTMPSPPEILTNDTSSAVSCYGFTDGFITLSISGGVPPYSLLWNTGDTTGSISNLAPGTYTVMITDASGCKKQRSWVIGEPDPLTASDQHRNIACHGDSTGSISLFPGGGTPPYQVSWNNGMSGVLISGLPAGEYEAHIVDSEGCEITFNTALTEPEWPLEITSSIFPPVCFYSTDGSISVEASGGVPPYSALWEDGSTGFVHDGLTAGSYSLHLSDAAGCVEESWYVVPMPDSMVIVAEVSNPSCFDGPADGSISLAVTGGLAPVEVNWNTGQSGMVISHLAAGTYRATVTDANRCSQYSSATLVAPPPLVISPTLVLPSCFGYSDGSILTNASGGTPPYSYHWSNGSGNDEIFHLQAAQYRLTLSDTNNCHKDSIMFLLQPAKLCVKHDITLPECLGASNGSIVLKPSGGTPPYLAVWNDGLDGLTRNNLKAGLYSFILSDSNDCRLTDSSFLAEQDCDLVIPNVITPNGDGRNDFFEIPNIEYYPDNELFIFNRWGTEVRHYNSYRGEWDGRDQGGSPVPDGTYYYILVLRNVKQYQGVITVLR